MTTTPAPPSLRRTIEHWACINAWKLAFLTALVTLIGVFVAVSLSLLLRPTRSYFFPLLSDVDKHHPERAVLRLAFVAATALMFATTSASLLHSRAMRFFSQTHPHLTLDTPPLDPQSDLSVRPADLVYRHAAHNHHHHHHHHHHHPVDHDDAVVPGTPRRRRVSRLHLLIFFPILFTLFLVLNQYPHILGLISSAVQRTHLLRLGIYALSLTWASAMCFLVWYFLKLQTMPDRVPDTEANVEGALMDAGAATTPNAQWVERVKVWGAWLVVVLRPICLTGQVVCIIKIAGLWLALDTFSISNIELVKRALLAALAFAEYTTAFFFAFFMTILAVDMRSKPHDPSMLET